MDSKKSSLTDLLKPAPHRFALAENDLSEFRKGQAKSLLRGGIIGGIIDLGCLAFGYETSGVFALIGAVTDGTQYTLRGIGLISMKDNNPSLYNIHRTQYRNFL